MRLEMPDQEFRQKIEDLRQKDCRNRELKKAEEKRYQKSSISASDVQVVCRLCKR